MLYEDLPGIELTVKDGNLILPAEAAGTDTILIIGPVTATGRANKTRLDVNPKRVRGSEDFIHLGLGLFNKDNALATAWKQVNDAGCRNIFCLELTGTTNEQRYANLHSIYSVIEENFSTDIILLTGVKADDTIITANVVLTAPREDYISGGGIAVQKETEILETFDSTDGVELLLTSPVLASTIMVTKITGSIPSVLSSLTDFTVDADSRRIMLTVPCATNETITVEYSTYDYNFGFQLAGFASVVSAKNNQVLGVIALKTAESSDLSDIKDYVDGQVLQKYNQYLSVVGGATLMFQINDEPYISDFAGAYSGMMSVLPSYSAPTNKVIPGAIMPSYNLSPNQVRTLINKHIVVPRVRNGRIVIADAITTANSNSDFVRLSTLRITNDAVNLIREIAEPYIGEPNSLARRNALDTAIRSGLTAMIKRGALNDFRFAIKSSLSDQIDGKMRINLDLVPAFETRRILVTVALKPSLE